MNLLSTGCGIKTNYRNLKEVTSKIDLEDFEMIDNHCHPLLSDYRDQNLTGFRACFSESSEQEIFLKSIPNTLSYIHLLSQLKLSFEFDDEDSYLVKRKEEGGLVQALFEKVKLKGLIVDDGFNENKMLSLSEFSVISGLPTYKILRLETEIEKLIRRYDTVSDIVKKLDSLLRNNSQIVGLKSIAAYRGGLDIQEVSESKASESLKFTKWMAAERGGSLNLKGEEHHHYFLGCAFRTASELNLPVQIHCGFGDSDLELHKSNPTLLTNCFKNDEYKNAKFVLLHCYPYVQEASYLASLFSNVYFDLSLAPFIVSQKMERLYLEAISGAPFNKILAGTDGHSIPETHFYGALMTRKGLTAALNALVEDSFLNESRAYEVAKLVLSENAKSIYGI